nr:MAG TPA: Innexin [Caudoviricetes sp.]
MMMVEKFFIFCWWWICVSLVICWIMVRFFII